MKRSFLKTGDGSITIHLPEWDEQYHSKHGAIAEASHVFIQEGFEYYQGQNPERTRLRILEIGFGTGLNCFLTKLHAAVQKTEVCYTGIEKFPVELNELSQLNYAAQLNRPVQDFEQLHKQPWEQWCQLSSSFSLFKHNCDFAALDYKTEFDLIYFDAFGPRVQPELWSEAIFNSMYRALSSNGVLVTYSAKGDVRRAMKKVGFTVERIPGPPFKRHMLRAVKLG